MKDLNRGILERLGINNAKNYIFNLLLLKNRYESYM